MLLCSCEIESGHGQHVHVAEVGGEVLQLGRGDGEPGAGGPDVAIVPADSCLRDHLG